MNQLSLTPEHVRRLGIAEVQRSAGNGIEDRDEVSGRRLIARRMSPVAVCRSSDSVRSLLRAASSWNRRVFSIAITASSANVWSSRQSRCRRRSRAQRVRHRWRRSAPFVDQRDREHAPEIDSFRDVADEVVGVFEDVGDRYHRARQNRSRSRGVAARRPWITLAQSVRTRGADIRECDKPEQRAIERYDERRAGVAELLGRGGDGVERGLRIGERLADDTQDFARRGLLLQRVGEALFRARRMLPPRSLRVEVRTPRRSGADFALRSPRLIALPQGDPTRGRGD